MKEYQRKIFRIKSRIFEKDLYGYDIEFLL